jgi:hypothetical protein
MALARSEQQWLSLRLPAEGLFQRLWVVTEEMNIDDQVLCHQSVTKRLECSYERQLLHHCH